MRVFVYEYLCATGAAPDTSLPVEGWAMLRALLEDCAGLPAVEPVTLLHPRLGGSRALPGVSVLRCDPEEEPEAFRALAGRADFTLVIAPEGDRILESRCRWVTTAEGRLLGPDPNAVALTADKLALAQHWRRQAVPTPPCTLLQPGAALDPSLFAPAAVCKPRDGAGSQATFLVRRPEDVPTCLAQAEREGWRGEMLLQTFAPGLPASVAFLLGPQGRVALTPAAQHLSEDGRFHYRGGTVPLPPALADRAVRLATRAVAVVPGLRGYAGVDLVLGAAPDGSADQAIEINPRPTTSYVGLRALALTNLFGVLLQLATGTQPEPIRWRPGSVRFEADGRVCWPAEQALT